jgi:phosphohistidine phosphatase
MIWLLRHGDAEDLASDDASRRLTPKGERQSRVAGAALAALGADIETCLTSPKVRAEETDALRGGDFNLAELTAGRGNCLLVGHEPDFSRAVALETGARVDFKKGGLAAIDGATLKALLRPDQIKRIAAS